MNHQARRLATAVLEMTKARVLMATFLLAACASTPVAPREAHARQPSLANWAAYAPPSAEGTSAAKLPPYVARELEALLNRDDGREYHFDGLRWVWALGAGSSALAVAYHEVPDEPDQVIGEMRFALLRLVAGKHTVTGVVPLPEPHPSAPGALGYAQHDWKDYDGDGASDLAISYTYQWEEDDEASAGMAVFSAASPTIQIVERPAEPSRTLVEGEYTRSPTIERFEQPPPPWQAQMRCFALFAAAHGTMAVIETHGEHGEVCRFSGTWTQEDESSGNIFDAVANCRVRVGWDRRSIWAHSDEPDACANIRCGREQSPQYADANLNDPAHRTLAGAARACGRDTAQE